MNIVQVRRRITRVSPVGGWGSVMMRFGALFVAVCMVLIAASIGVVLYLSFGWTGSEATIASLAALSGLALINAVTTRERDRADVSRQVADLSRGTADLARQVGEVGRRLAAMESDVAAAIHKARSAQEPLAAEISVLGTLVKQIADSVAAHDQAILALAEPQVTVAKAATPLAAPRAGAGDPIEARPVEATATADRSELGEPELQAEPEEPGTGRFKGMADADVVTLIRGAIESSRIDLYLQPIVTLPQRKVRYYEALTRLRTSDGELLTPADFAAFAEPAGLMPAVDNLMLFRCVQVVRRLQTKNRDIGLFCNLSAATLNDTRAFTEMLEFLEANKALVNSIVLEFPQAAVRSMGPIEHASLSALAEIGFRFSMDRMSDLHIEPREFAERGFRFIKAPASLLLRRVGQASDIHPADFSDLLGRFGIDLIAERIESEGTVVDLLDYDVRFGQGFLFSPPRPVRSEVLQSITERMQPATARSAAELPPVRGPEPLNPAQNATDRRTAIAQLARTTVRRA